MVREYAGTLYRHDLAEMVGTSRANLYRWARDNGVNINAHKYPEPVVKAVCEYYSRHGKQKTIEHFPGIKVRSIFERYNHDKRQIRWTGTQLVEAVKMAGLVSPKAQAKFFSRPNAFAGSIKSLWMKKFGMGQGCINGMTHWQAKELVTVKARYLRPKGESRDGKCVEFRRLILWVDMERCLKSEVPEFVRSAIKTMADFQRWIWKDENPKPKILRMIKMREVA